MNNFGVECLESVNTIQKIASARTVWLRNDDIRLAPVNPNTVCSKQLSMD